MYSSVIVLVDRILRERKRVVDSADSYVAGEVSWDAYREAIERWYVVTP